MANPFMVNRVLSLDIETKSEVDIKRGVYNYVNHHSFGILWLSYCYNYNIDQTVRIDITKTAVPQQVIDDLFDPTCLKIAANATFERVCFSTHFGKYLPPDQWTCTLVLAGRNGLPMNLDGAATQSRIEYQKDKKGKDYIKMFSIPQNPNKKNDFRLWNTEAHFPVEWQEYGDYNAQDVRAETAVRIALRHFPVAKVEEDLYHLDQKINDAGVLIDRVFVQQAIRINAVFSERIKNRVMELTGIRNPNSRKQILDWLNMDLDEDDEFYQEKLTKDSVMKLLKETTDETIKEVLECRQLLAKASIAKYKAMDNLAGWDGRVRGSLQFYGAYRTGRWAGRGVQVQNMTKHKFSKKVNGYDVNDVRAAIRTGDVHVLEALHPDVSDALSQCVRTAFISAPGTHFLAADYSAIEARVLAWLAGEQWRMDFFNRGGDIYIESAARMFSADPASIDKNNPLRQNGKVAELACGYGGGEGALAKMDTKQAIPKEQYPLIKDLWREENPEIVQCWRDFNWAAIRAIQNPGREVPVGKMKKCSFYFFQKNLYMRLPSGRLLTYVRAFLAPNKYGQTGVFYEGPNDKKVWTVLDIYGGKYVENAVQGIARDILAGAMLRLDHAGFKIVMHVHDEIVCEEPINGRSLDEVVQIMRIKSAWYADLPLDADGFVSTYYKKDDK